MTHAAAAALLRNAHLGPSGKPQADSPFAIDLSSRRVREAQRLLDGVRQGQPLGALLGYRFERSLHDLGFEVRHRALARGSRRWTSASATTAGAHRGPRGQQCRGRPRAGADLAGNRGLADSLADKRSCRPPTADQVRPRPRLDALVDAIDGLSDALAAEAAYQMARGNSSRLGSTLARSPAARTAAGAGGRARCRAAAPR